MELEICNFNSLIYDQACVILRSKIDQIDTWLYSLSLDCVACPFKRIAKITKDTDVSLKFNTAKSYSWRVIKSNGTDKFLSAADRRNVICHMKPRMGQFGLYELTVDETDCEFKTFKNPTNLYTPLVIAVGIVVALLACLAVFDWLTNQLQERLKKRHGTVDTQERTKPKRRIDSLDTVRGISIVFMIFVNDGAGGYSILKHVTWNGLLVGDLVFPCFMWIMGVCIPLSIFSQLSRGISRFSICLSIVKRSILLFIIGICLCTIGSEVQLERIRIFGVLQRFGVAYLVTGIIYALLSPRKKKEPKGTIFRTYIDILSLWFQWLMMLCIVSIHCVLTFQLDIPGCPRGYLGPGGRHEDGKYANCTGGAAGFIDRKLLGVNHIYQWPSINSVYGSGAFDPEGILGCLTSIFQVFLGVQCGQTLMYHQDWKGRILRWLSWALILGSVGSFLHFGDIIPVNKNLWSLSFVFVTSCFALCLLSACYLFIDVVKMWRGGPFRIPGMNALAMYIGHMICYQIFPFHWRIGKMKTHDWLLTESLWGVALWILVAYILHSKKIYISL